MAKEWRSVVGYRICQSGLACGPLYRLLQQGLMHVVAACLHASPKRGQKGVKSTFDFYFAR